MTTDNKYSVQPEFTGPVCQPGDFLFGFAGLDHGHAYGMTAALIQAGGQVAAVYDPDPVKTAAYREKFPQAIPMQSLDEMLNDASLAMVACASIPAHRVEIGLAVQRAGKHFFSDKPGFTNKALLAIARESVRLTCKIWAIYYSERVHNEAAVYAGDLIRQGAIGKVINITGLGPHRMAPATRPAWFFESSLAGGILTDLASHQIEQFFFFTGLSDATIVHSMVRNTSQPDHPHFQDYGELLLHGSGGESGYFRVDWFTPPGLGTWGDGRATILGSDGFIEIRKYIDLARDAQGDHVFLVNGTTEEYRKVSGTVGFPYFGRLILDCLNDTRSAMGQDYTFRVAELAMEAQEFAEKNG